MKFNKEIREAKKLTHITSRGLNQIIGALRKVDYMDTSESNMHLIDGMVRGLAYMNAARHQGMYFEHKLKTLKNIQRAKKKIMDEKIRKLKAQREDKDETYPPIEFYDSSHSNQRRKNDLTNISSGQSKICPYHRTPCLKEGCWAYSWKQEWESRFSQTLVSEHAICLALNNIYLGDVKRFDSSSTTKRDDEK